MADSNLVATERWRTTWPGACFGALAVTGLENQSGREAIAAKIAADERTLRARFQGMDRAQLRETGHLAAYHAYYRRFGQTYHVQHQLETVALKGKPIPQRTPVVAIGFMHELSSQLLTALHDRQEVMLPLTVDVGTGEERYTLYSGEDAPVKAGDIYVRDHRQVLSSIVLGPAAHARVLPESTGVVVCVYGPPGVPLSAVKSHLRAMANDFRVLAPTAKQEFLSVVSA